jgi:hypothetical protein
MHTGRTVFAQLMDFLPRHEFNKCVQRYDGNWRVRNFSCLDQFLCMAFAQLAGCESLREIETCLGALHPKLYHSGLRGSVARSTLADANEQRDWHIYYDFAQVLIQIARPLYAVDSFGVELEETAYALDSTMVELCLSLFPWARYQRDCGAVKLHTAIDLCGNIPCWIYISDGKTGDVNALDELVPEPGAFYIMDRGYVDFARLAGFTRNLSYFIVRARGNLACHRGQYRSVDRTTGLRSDHTITLRIPHSAERYPYPLRFVSYYDCEHHRRLVFLTNNFLLAALKIAQLYKCRWQVELFFKWIKQHLRINAFYGTSWNAVKVQIWIAISVYVLIAIIKKRFHLERSLAEIQQILSISLFEQVNMFRVLTRKSAQTKEVGSCNQLKLFDF